MLKPSENNGRDSQYEIRVGGECFKKGDATSVAVIFANLNGRNFSNMSPGSEGNHAGYLTYMEAQSSKRLQLGSSIEMVNPEGSILASSHIGAGLERATTASEQP